MYFRKRMTASQSNVEKTIQLPYKPVASDAELSLKIRIQRNQVNLH